MEILNFILEHLSLIKLPSVTENWCPSVEMTIALKFFIIPHVN